MLERLLAGLVASKNEAADEVLMETVRIGDSVERARALAALLDRKTETGIFALIRAFETLPQELKLTIVQRAMDLYSLIPEAGRSQDLELRVAAVRMVAIARLGKLSYVLSENLHHADESVSAAAAEALVSLARHAANETRRLQSGRLEGLERRAAVRELLDMRADIENAVYRALDVHRGARGQELLRAALLLADSPLSKTVSILSTSRHGGVSPMVKKLQQVPDAENVDAYLVGATHGQLRGQFAMSFVHIDEPPALEGLLRRTYLLKDNRLGLCVNQITRGAWWTEMSLDRELQRRAPDEAAKIGTWVASSGSHDLVQDEKLLKVFSAVKGDTAARLRLLRIAMGRSRGAPTTLLRRFLDDPDESLQRIAAREFVRRRPLDYSSVLLGLMKTAPTSVRRVASRAISASAFDHFYDRYEKLEEATRLRAGRAVFKLLPDAVGRLARKMKTGEPEQRIKALSMARELELADELKEVILALVKHENPKVRSKAVLVSGAIKGDVPDGMLEAALADADSRVRSNAIEVIESRGRTDLAPAIAQRIGSVVSRERANAIKALHSMKIDAAIPQLTKMLRDGRPEHRISAMWAAREAGIYGLIREIVGIAQQERDPRVKRYAVASVRMVAKQVREFEAARKEAV
jgi:HEAT repeat protein